ncbi:unnamed protein product [Ectocarpus fasciculatus]
MDRTRWAAPAASWDTRAFVREPLDTTMCRPPSPLRSAQQPSIPSQDGLLRPGQRQQQQREEEESMAAPATGQQAHRPPPRYTIRPPSRSFDGKFTLRQCSPPSVAELHANVVSSSSNFDFSSSSNSAGGGGGGGGGARGLAACSGSDSDASMDAEVASLTSGRRLGSGAEGLVRMVNAPTKLPRAEPRIRDAESAVALFALLSPSTHITPSPVQGHRQQQQQQQQQQTTKQPDHGGDSGRSSWDTGTEAGGEKGEEIWVDEPEAKRQRVASPSRCQTPKFNAHS